MTRAITIVLACLMLGGCGLWRAVAASLDSGAAPDAGAAGAALSADPYWALSWVALLCLLAGAAGLVASFMIPIVPRTAAGASLGVGLALLVAKAFLVKFMGVLVWGLLAVLVWLAWSFGRRFMLDRFGRKLARDDPRAGVAVMSVARGWTGKKARAKRKKLLERVTPS